MKIKLNSLEAPAALFLHFSKLRITNWVAFFVLACPTLANPGCWSTTGNMTMSRSRHTATLLPDGTVLVAGGLTTFDAPTPTAELYDPATGLWSLTGSMAEARSRHVATLLPNGKVLVVGGRDSNGLALNTAGLFDPVGGVWSATGSLHIPRDSHTLTLLTDGRVLVTGGLSLGEGYDNPVEKTAEIYDPITETWSLADHMAQARFGHTATLLADGRVLIAGGAGPRSDGVYTVTAEIYDPVIDRWYSIDPMSFARGSHTAELLMDGSVLVAGGLTLPADGRNVTASAELYIPSTGRWHLTGSMNVARSAGPFGATLLFDGRYLVAGGRTNTAEIYDPSIGKWTATDNMTVSRTRQTMTLLDNGNVLAVGGENAVGIIGSTEYFTP